MLRAVEDRAKTSNAVKTSHAKFISIVNKFRQFTFLLPKIPQAPHHLTKYPFFRIRQSGNLISFSAYQFSDYSASIKFPFRYFNVLFLFELPKKIFEKKFRESSTVLLFSCSFSSEKTVRNTKKVASEIYGWDELCSFFIIIVSVLRT